MADIAAGILDEHHRQLTNVPQAGPAGGGLPNAQILVGEQRPSGLVVERGKMASHLEASNAIGSRAAPDRCVPGRRDVRATARIAASRTCGSGSASSGAHSVALVSLGPSSPRASSTATRTPATES